MAYAVGTGVGGGSATKKKPVGMGDVQAASKPASKPSSSDLTRQLAEEKRKWMEAQRRGDTAAMAAANARANQLRAMGANEAEANRLATGRPEGLVSRPSTPSTPSRPSAPSTPSRDRTPVGTSAEEGLAQIPHAPTSSRPSSGVGMGDVRREEKRSPGLEAIQRRLGSPGPDYVPSVVRLPQAPQTPKLPAGLDYFLNREANIQRQAEQMNTILGSVQQGPKAFRSAVMTSAYSSTGTMPRTTPYVEAARPAEVNDAIMELAAAKRAWVEANARGDTAAMQQAHERANQIRARLGSYAQEAERQANQIATGRPEGLPPRTATTPVGGATPAPAQTGAAAPSRPAGSAGTGRTGAGGAPTGGAPQPPPQEPPQEPPPSEPPAWLQEPPQPPPPPEQPPPWEPESVDQLRSDLAEGADLFRAIQNEPIDVQPYFANAASQILELAKQIEEEIRQEFQQNQNVLDPQTEEALRVLREQMELTLQATREELNRRGLFESGILLDLENKIRQRGLTETQQILAQRLQALRDRLEQKLNQIREWKLSAYSDLTMRGAEAQAQAARDYEERRQQFLRDFLNMRVQQRRQQYEDAVARYDRDIERRLKEYDRLYDEWRDAKEDEKWQYEQELKLLELQLEMDYRAKELEIRRQEAQRRAQGSGSSGGDATAEFLADLEEDLRSGMTIGEAINWIDDHRSALRSRGVDPDAAIRALYDLAGSYVRPH